MSFVSDHSIGEIMPFEVLHHQTLMDFKEVTVQRNQASALLFNF